MSRACDAVGLKRATYYRAIKPKVPETAGSVEPEPRSHNRLSWMIAARENSALAKQLFEEAIPRYGLVACNLTVHHDRGAPMTSHTFKELLKDLGVNQSMSRPRVSNDNACSESLFRTTKYQPDYPGRFADIDAARVWFQEFFDWYNEQHHHDGLALFTPGQVFRRGR